MHVQEILIPNGLTRYIVVHANGDLVLPIARYLKYLDSIGRARNTLRSYAYDLRLYWTYLDHKQMAHNEVTLDDLAGFVLWSKNPYQSLDLMPILPVEQARTNRTINHTLTVIVGFYDYLWRQGDTAADMRETTHQLRQGRHTIKSFLHHIAKGKMVDANLLRQKERAQRPQTLSAKEIGSLVAGCKNARDRLLLTLLFESSMRIGEALALWIEDIDIPRRQIHIRDRGELVNGAEIKTPDSCRSIDVSTGLINAVLDYIARFHDDDVTTNHVFIKLHGPNAGKPLTYPDVYDLFQRLGRKTGIDASAHVLRHSSLTDLARKGMRPEVLQKRAGHAQFATTYQLYVHPNDDDVRAEWERVQEQINRNE